MLTAILGSTPFRRIADTSSRCSLCDPVDKRVVHSRLPACAGGFELLKDLGAVSDTDRHNAELFGTTQGSYSQISAVSAHDAMKGLKQ